MCIYMYLNMDAQNNKKMTLKALMNKREKTASNHLLFHRASASFSPHDTLDISSICSLEVFVQCRLKECQTKFVV